MKIKILFILLCIVGLSVTSWAQTITVSGVVSDETGAPMPGATVVEAGTTNGVVTDFDGNYYLKVVGNGTLVFTYIGYTTQSINVKSRTKIDVKMAPDSKEISDVVVIGYGTQKRESLIGSVSDVSGQALRKSGLSNISHMIQDQLPGVYTEIRSGQPGADDAKITVRGISTFGDNSPLILIDGVVAAGGFSQVDPGEISSISVLKDASSTAIYGVKGANGVILITTRRGAKGSPRVTVGAELTAKTMFDRPDQLGSYDVLMLGQEANKNAGTFNGLRGQGYINGFLDSSRDQILYPDIDWYDELVRNVGWENQTRFNVTGGTDFVRYFAQISTSHQGDIIKDIGSDGYYDPQFSYDKINFRTNLDFSLSKTTTLQTDISGRTELKKTPNTEVDPTEFSNVFKFIDQATPYLFPVFYPADFLQRYPDPYDPTAGLRFSSAGAEQPYLANPYNYLYQSGMRKYRTDVLDFQVGLQQDLDFITKGLKAFARVNYSTMFSYGKTEAKDLDRWLYDVERDLWKIEVNSGQNYNSKPLDFHSSGGEGYKNNNRNLYYEFKLAYNRSFGLHNVDFTGVFSRREESKNVGVFPYYHEDWVSRLVYDYDGKYMVEASAGYNGSEKFAPGKRFGFFPAAAVGWNIAREEFIKDNVKWLNKLKVRYSIGKTGSEAGERFMYEGGWIASDLRLGYNRFGYPAAGEVARYAETKIPNPNATWETAYKQNLGLDVELFKKELSFGVDIYKEKREGIFIRVPVGSFYHPGFGENLSDYGGKVGLPVVNLGETKNQGVEVVTKYSHTTARGITYTIGGNINFADNRIVYKADRPFAPDYQKQAGKPIQYNLGYKTNGYVNSFEEAINAVSKVGGTNPGDYYYADFNGNGSIETDDRIPMKTSQPQIIYGFHLGAHYKDFDLTVRFFGKDGQYYPTSKLYPNFEEYLLEAKTVHLDRWSPENTDAQFPAFANSGTRFYRNASDANIIDASYLKLQSVTLGYTLKSAYLKNLLRIQTIQLNLSGQNLASWSKVPYGDPEAANGVGSGYGNYPLVSRYILGVNVNF